MSSYMAAAALAAACMLMPNRILILLSVLGVMLTDTPLVPKQAVYFSRFVPSGVLALRTLHLMLNRGSVTNFLLVKAWLPFMMLSVFSIGYSIDPSLSAQRLLSAAFIICGFGIGIPLFFPHRKDHQQLIQLIGLLLGSAALYSLYLTAFAGGTSAFVHGRASGVFRNPNTLGLMAMQAAFLIFYMWQRETGFRRKILFAILPSIAAVLLLSGSRASSLGLAAGAVVYVRTMARLERRKLRMLFHLAAVGVMLLMVVDSVLPGQLDSLLRTETSSRTILWERAWVLAQDNLLLGVGFCASDEVFRRDAMYLKSIGIYLFGPHSSLMRLLVDLGLLGVLLAGWAFSMILRQAWRYLPYFDDPLLGAVLFSAVIASLTNSLFESWMFGFGSAPTVPFWLLLSLLAYQTDIVRHKVLAQRAYEARRQWVPIAHRQAPEAKLPQNP
ncbi:MAG: O-antigen ligase family protein [Acidobacteriota bacterium]